jgi:hypothetical protein
MVALDYLAERCYNRTKVLKEQRKLPMADLLDSLAYLDLIDRVDEVVSTFIHADWKGAYKRHGLAGLGGELVASLSQQNTWTFWVPRDAGFSGIEIERLLTRHGVRVWGRGFLDDSLYFHVKKRQARWAEYLLWRAGIPVVSRPFDSRNQAYSERHPTSPEPPGGGDHTKLKKGLLDSIYDLLG